MKAAVVIGVSTYADPKVPSLNAARLDAEAIAETFRGEKYGYEVTLLTDDLATRANVLRCLHDFRETSLDNFVLFFAGHGAAGSDGTSIVLHDATDYELGISLQELVSSRVDYNCSVTVLLDCCHAGAVDIRGISSVTRITREDLRQALATSNANLSAIAACLSAEVAYEYAGLGHGLLTYNLLEGLSGYAADDVGHVTPTSLYTFVAALMRDNTSQTPAFRGSVDSKCVLGVGFTPRRKRAMGDEDLIALCESAEGQYENYMAQRARPQSLADRRQSGFREDCRLLEEKMRWLDKITAENPSVSSEPDFSSVVGAFRNEQAYLCNLSEGTRIPGATVESLLGSGGFGSVWKVLDGNNSVSAFKVYNSNDLWDIDKIGRFQTGYRANRQLTHPNIVEVYEERLVPLGFFMQAIDGPNLRDAGASSWEIGAQLRFLTDAAETLQYAHDKGVIHRDIKPENILVRWDPTQGLFEPVVSDFDLAWFSTATQRTQAAMGMALYAPPEQRDFSNQDAVRRVTVDVFSFAQVCFFLITGRDPQVNQLERNSATLRSALADRLPASSLSEIIKLYETCSEYDPDHRPPGLDPVCQALRRCRADYERAQRGGTLNVAEFLIELSNDVSGVLLDVAPKSRSFSMQSRTRRTEISLMRTRDRGDSCGFDFRFRPTMEFGQIGSKNADRRKQVNQQLDRSLARCLVSASRRSGHEGAFEVFVEVEPVALNAGNVSGVADACLRTIRVMEAFSTM